MCAIVGPSAVAFRQCVSRLVNQINGVGMFVGASLIEMSARVG